MKGEKIIIKNVEKLQNRIQQEKSPQSRMKLTFLNLVANNSFDFEKLCRLYGIALSTGYQWVREWNKNGYESVEEKENRGGRPARLSENKLHQLSQYLEKKDRWHIKEVKQLIKNRFDVDISEDQIARIMMRKMNMLFSKPMSVDNKVRGGENHEALMELYYNIFNNFADAVITIDLQYRVTFWNITAEKIFGWTAEEAIGRDMSELIVPQHLKSKRDRIFSDVQTGGSFSGIEIELICKDRDPINVNLTVSPLINSDRQIIGLSFIIRDISNIKSVQGALQSRIELEKLIANISTNFINILTSKIDNEIYNVLKAIGEFSGVDRSYVFLFYDNGKKMSNTHEWCKEGIEPQIDILQGISNEEDYPYFTERIRRLEVIHVPDVADLPPEASLEKENFQMLGIKSLILVPIVYGKKLNGFLGFDSVKAEKTWKEEDIRLLKMVGEIFANTLEHKNSEEILQENVARYRSLFDHSPISLWKIDFSEVKKYIEDLKAQGVKDIRTYLADNPETVYYCISLVKIIDVNNATLKMFKARSKQSLMEYLNNVLYLESPDIYIEEFVAIGEGKTTFENEYSGQTLAGDKLNLAVKWTAAPGYEDTLSNIFKSIIDITQSRRAGEVLQESEARYRSLFEDSPIALWECDMSEVKTYIKRLKAKGVNDIKNYLGKHPEVVAHCTSLVNLHDVNRAALKIYKAKNKKELLRDLKIIFTEESFDLFREELVDISEGKTSFERETKNVTLEGDELNIALKWTAAPGYEESLSKVFASVIDISKVKQAEKELEILLEQIQAKHLHTEMLAQDLKKERDTLQAIMQYTGTHIAFLDTGFNFISVNSAYAEASGYTTDELIGRNHFELFPDKENQAIFEKVRDTGEAVEFIAMPFEFANQPWRGVTYWDWTLNPVKDSSGHIYGFVFSSTDVTDFKKSEEIRLENERQQYANRAKSDFLTIMSHELRTPLTSIRGYSFLLKEKIQGELNEKQESYVENILTSSNHLLELINNILDMAKIEAGKLELLIEKISVPEIIDETLRLMEEKARINNIILEKNIDPELDFIEADRQKFKQILFNLLSNALKFSKEEGDIVSITAKKEGDMAQISVSDTGIGIKKKDMDRLFMKFEQLDSGISRKYGGAGLGLAISKQLAELHGGKIVATSRYGKGSTFTFLLPIEANKKAKK